MVYSSIVPARAGISEQEKFVRRVFVVAALVAAAVGLTACDSAVDQRGAPVTTSAPSLHAITSDQQTAGPASAPAAGAPVSGSAPAPVTASANASETSAPANGGFTDVDASKYQIDGSYFFQSPSGNIKCGILASAPYGVGCQLAKATIVTPKLPNCTDAPDRKVAAHLYEGKSEFLCTSQGIFVGISPDGSPAGGAVLNYGESLTANGYTCSSSSQGVRCVAGGHGFAIAAENQHIF